MRKEVNEDIDRYQIISTLNHNSHSTVWLAKHNSLSGLKIVKGIPKNSQSYERLKQEAEILNILNHPCIPIIYDVEEDQDYCYIIEQYFEGDSLSKLCTERLLSEKEVYHYFFQICSIIEYLHSLPQKVLHLDIKPENVIIDGDTVRLVDFGSAVLLCNSSRADSISMGFSAPEQQQGFSSGCFTDIYALGQLLRFMLGHSTVSAKARKRLERIAGRCCTKQPWIRISTVTILIKMLESGHKSGTCNIGTINLFHRETQEGKLPANSETDLKRCRKIAVLGLEAKEGATHIALTLANYLAEYKNEEVCLVEASDHNDIICLLKEECREATLQLTPIRLKGVTYFNSKAAFDAYGERQFDRVIFDCGSNTSKASTVFGQCDMGIAVAGAAQWRRKETEKIEKLEKLSTTELNPGGESPAKTEWTLFINLADKKRIRHLCCSNVRVFPFPFEPDPIHPGKVTVNVFEKVMK